MSSSEKKISPEESREACVLVCLSSSPSNYRVIKAAAKTADAFQCPLKALYVGKLPDSESEDDQLNRNIRLAKSLGAKVQLTESTQIAYAIAEYAKLSEVTDLFIGHSPAAHSVFSQSIAEQVMRYLPNMDIHIIPDAQVSQGLIHPERHFTKLTVKDTLRMLAIMLAATLLSVLFDRSSFSNANIITIYILGVLMTAVVTADQRYGLIAAFLYILLFNFLFIEPRYSLMVYDSAYLVTYIVTVIASVITGSLASKIKSSASIAASNAYQAKILLDTNEAIETAKREEDILLITGRQLENLFHTGIVYYPVRDGKLIDTATRFQTLPSEELQARAKTELEIARYAKEHNCRAGAFTGYFPNAAFQYLSIRVEDRIYGIIGIERCRQLKKDFENTILLSLLGQCAISIENKRNYEAREQARLTAERERLRSALIRSFSHDLRTPLTAISGNADTLLHNSSVLSDAEKKGMYADIKDDAGWLINLVENLMSMTKLDEGKDLNRTAEIVDDVIAEALRHVDRHIEEHRLIVRRNNDYLIASMDVRLITQVIINLVNNAVKYTPAGSVIELSAEEDDEKIWVIVEDDGPGIAEADQPHIFDMFYTADKKVTDSRRSLGVGLSLCRAIMQAHGEEIELVNREPHGAKFRFSLKKERVDIGR